MAAFNFKEPKCRECFDSLTCNVCGGSGLDDELDECPYCDGSGSCQDCCDGTGISPAGHDDITDDEDG